MKIASAVVISIYTCILGHVRQHPLNTNEQAVVGDALQNALNVMSGKSKSASKINSCMSLFPHGGPNKPDDPLWLSCKDVLMKHVSMAQEVSIPETNTEGLPPASLSPDAYPPAGPPPMGPFPSAYPPLGPPPTGTFPSAYPPAGPPPMGPFPSAYPPAGPPPAGAFPSPFPPGGPPPAGPFPSAYPPGGPPPAGSFPSAYPPNEPPPAGPFPSPYPPGGPPPAGHFPSPYPPNEPPPAEPFPSPYPPGGPPPAEPFPSAYPPVGPTVTPLPVALPLADLLPVESSPKPSSAGPPGSEETHALPLVDPATAGMPPAGPPPAGSPPEGPPPAGQPAGPPPAGPPAGPTEGEETPALPLLASATAGAPPAGPPPAGSPEGPPPAGPPATGQRPESVFRLLNPPTVGAPPPEHPESTPERRTSGQRSASSSSTVTQALIAHTSNKKVSESRFMVKTDVNPVPASVAFRHGEIPVKIDKEGYEKDWQREHRSESYPESSINKEHHPDFSSGYSFAATHSILMAFAVLF